MKKFYSVVIIVGILVAIPASAGEAFYRSDQEREGVARALCRGKALLGGGAFISPEGLHGEQTGLRTSHPISDRTGTFAWGTTAIGWQAASSGFEDHVASFAICADRDLESRLELSYVREQGEGTVRTFCPAGWWVIGGGGVASATSGSGAVVRSIRSSYPISDETGVVAWGDNGIGWQVSSEDFGQTVIAFAVCAKSTEPGAVVPRYEQQQAVGVSRSECAAHETLTGGGGFASEENPLDNASLIQSYPISDSTGTIARGRRGIGWQVASAGYDDLVVSHAICVSINF